MTQNSTPLHKGPSASTIDFLRNLARAYNPHCEQKQRTIIHLTGCRPLAEC